MMIESSLVESLLLQSARDGVATLTLNTPANFNALSSAMIAALQAALDQLADDASVRVVVLAASGRAFCAGHDLREMQEVRDIAQHRSLFDRCSKMMMTLDTMPQPVIAKIQGLATAAGCQLVASCDLAVASHQARFATSGINLGLFCSTPAVALLRNLSAKHAAEMLFTGEFIDAATAVTVGLINRAVAANGLDAATAALAARIASQSRTALTSGKQLLRKLREPRFSPNVAALAEAYAIAASNMAHDMQTRDANAGIAAFLSKSPRIEWQHE